MAVWWGAGGVVELQAQAPARRRSSQALAPSLFDAEDRNTKAINHGVDCSEKVKYTLLNQSHDG